MKKDKIQVYPLAISYPECMEKIRGHSLYFYHNIVYKKILYPPKNNIQHLSVHLPVLQEEVLVPKNNSNDFVWKWRFKTHTEIQENSPEAVCIFGLHCSADHLYYIKSSGKFIDLQYNIFKTCWKFIQNFNKTIENITISKLESIGAPLDCILLYKRNSGWISVSRNGINVHSLDISKNSNSLFLEYFKHIISVTIENKWSIAYPGTDIIIRPGENYVFHWKNFDNSSAKEISSLKGFNDYIYLNVLYLGTKRFATSINEGFFWNERILEKISQREETKDTKDKKLTPEILRTNSLLLSEIFQLGKNRDPERDDQDVEREINQILNTEYIKAVQMNGLFRKWLSFNQQYVPFRTNQSIKDILYMNDLIFSDDQEKYILVRRTGFSFIFFLFLDFIRMKMIEEKIKKHREYIFIKLRDGVIPNINEMIEGEILDCDIDVNQIVYGSDSGTKNHFRLILLGDNILWTGNVMGSKKSITECTPLIDSNSITDRFSFGDLKFYFVEGIVLKEKDEKKNINKNINKNQNRENHENYITKRHRIY
jgi:hypothetical protein